VQWCRIHEMELKNDYPRLVSSSKGEQAQEAHMNGGIVLAPDIDLSQQARAQGIRFCLRYPGRRIQMFPIFF
jgi:hypothetical protein